MFYTKAWRRIAGNANNGPRMFRIILFSLVTILMLLSSVWAIMALWFQTPWGGLGRYVLPALWVLCVVGLGYRLWFAEPWWHSLSGYVVMLVLLIAWWNTIKPSHDRDWADDVAFITTGTVQGDEVTLSHVRNFHWRSKDDYDIRWETREYDLSRLISVDMLTSSWGLPGIAHVLVSFGFEDGDYLVFTVEIRRKRHQSFSAVGGFFKEFELAIVATDERDAVRVRTNIREEDVSLYRIGLNAQDAKELFLSFVSQANYLAEHPRFYHTVTGNCTTIVYSMMKQIVDGLPLDYRLLLSGRLPSYVQAVNGMASKRPLTELKQRGRISQLAREAGDSKRFSSLIRQGVPGWE